MGQITISVTSTVTLDGAVQSNSGTVVIPASEYSQQTRNFSDTFDEVGQASQGYVVVINTGPENLYVQFASGPNYIVFEVVVGAHGVFPTSLSNGLSFVPDKVSIRGETSSETARAIIITTAVE